MRYRKKPTEIEAYVFNQKNSQLPLWALRAFHDRTMFFDDEGTLRIRTLAGLMAASPGDYIIRDAMGEIYACQPDIFNMMYERIDKHEDSSPGTRQGIQQGQAAKTLILPSGEEKADS